MYDNILFYDEKTSSRPWETVARADDKLIYRAFSPGALTYDCF